MTRTVVLAGEAAASIPDGIAEQLNLMIRYAPYSSGAGQHRCRVRIEERLMLGSVLLANWAKHEEDMPPAGLNSEEIEQLSCLWLNPLGQVGSCGGERGTNG